MAISEPHDARLSERNLGFLLHTNGFIGAPSTDNWGKNSRWYNVWRYKTWRLQPFSVVPSYANKGRNNSITAKLKLIVVSKKKRKDKPRLGALHIKPNNGRPFPGVLWKTRNSAKSGDSGVDIKSTRWAQAGGMLVKLEYKANEKNTLCEAIQNYPKNLDSSFRLRTNVDTWKPLVIPKCDHSQSKSHTYQL